MSDAPYYFANAGPMKGPILDRDHSVPGSIGVYDSPAGGLPIGEASGFTRDDQCRAVRRLIVHRAAVPGRWVVVDRAFVRVEG